MKKGYLYRFLVYPVIFMLIWNYLYINYHDNMFVQMVREVMISNIPLTLVESKKILIFGYIFGYVYGTGSLLLKVRSFKSPVAFAIVFLVKVYFSIMVAGIFGFYIILLEVVTVPLVFMFSKKLKQKKEEKMKKQREQEYNLIKGEILKEIREQLSEENVYRKI